jgi:hypothetical protein
VVNISNKEFAGGLAVFTLLQVLVQSSSLKPSQRWSSWCRTPFFHAANPNAFYLPDHSSVRLLAWP